MGVLRTLLSLKDVFYRVLPSGDVEVARDVGRPLRRMVIMRYSITLHSPLGDHTKRSGPFVLSGCARS